MYVSIYLSIYVYIWLSAETTEAPKQDIGAQIYLIY